MTRTIQLIIGAVLLVNIVNGATLTVATASSASATNTAFNSTPNVVLNIANTTDQGKWANIPASQVKYGGNLAGGTIYAYGYATSANVITTITTRSINSTIVANGTDSTEASVISDAQATGQTFAYTRGPIAQTIPGYLVLAYTGTDTNSANQVYAVAWAGSTNSGSKVALTAITTPTNVVTSTSATGATSSTTMTTATAYDYTVQGVVSEDGIVYVYFVQTSTVTVTYTGGSTTSPPATTTDTGLLVQGFYAANGTLYYTAQKTIATLTNVVSSGTAAVTNAICGLSNTTNSTSINCVYNVGSGAVASGNTPTVSYTSFARATGTAGTPTTAATSTYAGPAGASFLSVSYTPSGVVGSNYASGGLISQYNSTGATPTPSYALSLWNTTGTAGLVPSGISSSSATGVVSANGFTFTNGYVIIGSYASSTAGAATTTYTFFAAPYYSNGTAQSSQTTLATVDGGYGNFFVDVNGSAWFGFNSYEKGTTAYSGTGTSVGPDNVVTGTVGKVYAKLYSSSTTFGSVLSTFFAFLALIIATLRFLKNVE